MSLKDIVFIDSKNESDTKTFQTKINTSPLNYGGASFKTHVLLEDSKGKLVYKPYYALAIFCFLFLAVGLGLLFFTLFSFFKSTAQFPNLITLAVGSIFTTASCLMFYNYYKPRVFDKQLVVYFKSHKKLTHKRELSASKNHIFFDTIKAIQIIGEHVKSKNGSYKSFELNLVLEDGSRQNIIDHGNLKSIINDAEVLSEFLNITIWHAKSNEN